MNDSEDFTPSLWAGIVRYRTRVVAAVVAFALLGAVYALVSWKPEATMKVVVQVASGVGGQNSNVNADRATSEVAAQLASPQVVEAASSQSGVTIDKVSASASQGESTIAVVVSAGSDTASEAAANALLPAYQQVQLAQNQQQLDEQLRVIDASIADVENNINLTTTQLAGVAAASNEAATLRTELDTLNARRNQLRTDRDAAQIAASTAKVGVSVGSGPNKGPGRVSLLSRYVPVGIVLGFLVSIAVIAVVERRRPWLSDPTTAGRLFGAPVVAVGSRTETVAGMPAEGIAPVVAMALQRAAGDADPGIALLVPRGPRDLSMAALTLAADMEPVLDRTGATVTLLSLTSTGRILTVVDGRVDTELAGLSEHLGNRDTFVKQLAEVGLDADLVVLVPVVDIEQEVLLDLVLMSDACIVTTATGSDLAPLFSLRRDLDALGVRADGVVLDPSVPLAPPPPVATS